MRIHRSQLPFPKAVFLTKLQEYIDARIAHLATVDEPPPMPEHECFRLIYESGVPVEIVEDTILSASYTRPDNSKVQLELEPGKFTIISAENPYYWELFQEWLAVPNVCAPYVPPAEPTQGEVEAALGNNLAGVNLAKLMKAKILSDLAFRLGKPPGQLTGPEIQAERQRLASIYKAI